MAARGGVFVLVAALLVACGGSVAFEPGAMRYRITFDTPAAWDGPRADLPNTSFMQDTERGTLRVGVNTERYAWALHTDAHTDIIIETRPRLTTNAPNNGYGVGCRMRDDGSGYYFLVSRDGYHAILRADGGITENLTPWTFSAAVDTGVNARNTLRASCVGDALVMTVNGEAVARSTDTRYTDGASGIIVSGSDAGPTNVAYEEISGYDIAD